MQPTSIKEIEIYWELCKRLKFNYTDRRYIHKQEYVVQNATQNFPGYWDTDKSYLESQT